MSSLFLTLLLAAGATPPRTHAAPTSPAAVAAPVPVPVPEDVDAGAAILLDRAGAGEPPLDEVQRAAARQAATAHVPTRRRARAAALLPKLTVEVLAEDRRYHVAGLTSTSEVDYVRHTPGSHASLRLSWDLGGLAFSEAELRLAERDDAAAKARAEAIDRVTKLYFARRRLLLSLAVAPAASARERAEREVEVEELGGALDALTGGLWSSRGGR